MSRDKSRDMSRCVDHVCQERIKRQQRIKQQGPAAPSCFLA